jgi:transcriptional regulator with XRE-family HTH domain
MPEARMDQAIDQGVGGEVKRLRRKRDWSMAKLAVEADMSVSGVSMIENGKRNLTTTTLAKLARAFGVEVADLFPKAEAPLWSDKTPARRSPAFSFEEAREQLERYCERWEKRLDDGAMDDRALEEFLTTMQGWIPMLDIALQAEIHSKGLVNGGTNVGRANRRYLGVFDRILPILRSQLDEASGRPEEETNVVYLKDALASLGRLPKRAVG